VLALACIAAGFVGAIAAEDRFARLLSSGALSREQVLAHSAAALRLVRLAVGAGFGLAVAVEVMVWRRRGP